jgi:hypothetical protein
LPTRTCRKNTVPRESSLTAAAAISMIGAATNSTSDATATSNERFSRRWVRDRLVGST